MQQQQKKVCIYINGHHKWGCCMSISFDTQTVLVMDSSSAAQADNKCASSLELHPAELHNSHSSPQSHAVAVWWTATHSRIMFRLTSIRIQIKQQKQESALYICSPAWRWSSNVAVAFFLETLSPSRIWKISTQSHSRWYVAHSRPVVKCFHPLFPSCYHWTRCFSSLYSTFLPSTEWIFRPVPPNLPSHQGL